jgi:biopolymer transport protein ExbB
VGAFIESGGIILWVIAAVTCVMWTLIFERLWFYKGTLPKIVGKTVKDWDARDERTSWNAHQIRIAMISRVSSQIRMNIDLIGTFVALCPLFGLLGTVVGMIEVFNVLSTSGGADAKAMAGGVKQATIPTMAGMVAAISGVFGNTFVTQIADREGQLLEDHMTMDH